MANKPAGTTSSAPAKPGSRPSSELGKEPTAAMLDMQKELLGTYEQASRAWLARVKSEIDLWSELATKVMEIRSIPQAMNIYQQSVARRMQMAADDVRQLTEDYQKVAEKFSRALPGGWHAGST